jgi:hypothetical protein
MNDEILIKYNDALLGHWRYKSDNIQFTGWFYNDHEKMQPDGYFEGSFAGKQITRDTVMFDYKLYCKYGEYYLQLNKKKYRIKLLERDAKKNATMILINAKGKEEIWSWSD